MKELARNALSGVVVSVLLMAPALAAQTQDHQGAKAPADHRKGAQARHSRHSPPPAQRQRRLSPATSVAGNAASHPASVHTAAFIDDTPVPAGSHPGTPPGPHQVGLASWYGGQRWHGNRTSSGDIYNQESLTAAHASLPMGSRVRVTLVNGERNVVVTINDRPGTRRRIIDLSRAAARELGILDRGVAMVTLSRL